jgi:3-phosphoglycerate kinase
MIGHLGRPKGKKDSSFSLNSVKDRLTELCSAEALSEPITLIDDITVEPRQYSNDMLVVLENLRFWPGEREKDEKFALVLAKWGDVYVDNAFGNSHRDHASMTLLPEILPESFAGPELIQEVEKVETFMNSIRNPFVAILGGAKINTKAPLVKVLIKSADTILLGGALANTVLQSRGIYVGFSLIEEDVLREVKKLDDKKIILPVDAIIGDGSIRDINKIGEQESILDIGPDTIKNFVQHISSAKTILLNGPMGKFEDDKFARGTHEIAQAIGKNKAANTLAGGGETVEALERLGLVEEFSARGGPASGWDFVSTGGGAMLTFLAGEKMPGLEAVSL